MQRPDNEIPAIAPVRGVLNRTPDFVLALTSTMVFSTAVEWTVEAYRRLTGGVPMSGWGFGRPEPSGHSSPPMLFGIEWANGDFASNMPGGDRMNGGLSNAGTSRGSPQHFQVTFRLDHLPPPGPFTVVTAWPFYDVPEAQVSFDASAILDAVNDVEQLWEPVEPPVIDFDQPPPRLTPEQSLLVMPRTGWFGEHFDPTPRPPRFDEHGNQLRYIPVFGDEHGNLTPGGPTRHGWRMAREDEE